MGWWDKRGGRFIRAACQLAGGTWLVLGEQCESHPDPHCTHSPTQETMWGALHPCSFLSSDPPFGPPMVWPHCHATARALPTPHPGWPAACHTKNPRSPFFMLLHLFQTAQHSLVKTTSPVIFLNALADALENMTIRWQENFLIKRKGRSSSTLAFESLDWRRRLCHVANQGVYMIFFFFFCDASETMPFVQESSLA